MKSVTRILFNKLAKKYLNNIAYPLLDIGGGVSPSYLRYIKPEERYIVDTDPRVENMPNAFCLDLDKQSIKTHLKFKTVFAFNFFEHVYDHRKIFNEIKKVMLPAGELHIFIPFLIPWHPDPDDYLRYTESGLKRLLADNGFKITKFDIAGGYFVVLLQYLQYFPLLGNLFLIFLPLAKFLDNALGLFVGDKFKRRYVLGYYLVAKKGR